MLQREGYTEQNYTGEAYAFFDNPKAIANEDLRPESDLTLRFAKGEENFLKEVNADRGLRAAVRAARNHVIYSSSDPRNHQERLKEAEKARNIPFGYGLHARYDQSNEEAADKLTEVMNYVNGCFIPGKDPFRAVILYKDNQGRYISRE